MSCPHGNHPDACDICDEIAAAYNSGVEHSKREWVGLTHDELIEIYNRKKDWDHPNSWEYEQAIEAKLKEKNT